MDNKSEWNDALGYLNDLRNYFRAVNSFASQQDAYHWFESMLILYRELYNFIPKSMLDEAADFVKDLKPSIHKHQVLIKTNPNLGIPPELYWKLHDFNLLLKHVYGVSGLETKTLDDANKALI